VKFLCASAAYAAFSFIVLQLSTHWTLSNGRLVSPQWSSRFMVDYPALRFPTSEPFLQSKEGMPLPLWSRDREASGPQLFAQPGRGAGRDATRKAPADNAGANAVLVCWLGRNSRLESSLVRQSCFTQRFPVSVWELATHKTYATWRLSSPLWSARFMTHYPPLGVSLTSNQSNTLNVSISSGL